MGESDKMSSDSVTNRECRAVPTPNVILLYDEHGLKGSDPSVYALLYMLDFGAAGMVDYAAS